VIDPQDVANELIAAERMHKEIGQFSDNRGLQVGMRRLGKRATADEGRAPWPVGNRRI
jgi:hypothetical protein